MSDSDDNRSRAIPHAAARTGPAPAAVRYRRSVSARPDPYAVLGVSRDADDAAIHSAYRKAVRRTHPDAGGSAGEFEAVQEAYEVLRDPDRRRASQPATASPRPRAASPRPTPAESVREMEDLLTESQRLEDEARRLAGLPPRYDRTGSSPDETEDSLTAILRDASQQLRDIASEGARELRRRARRRL